jgi:integrase
MAGGIGSRKRAMNRLSDRRVRSFIAQARAGTAGTKKLADGGGLYLILTPAGSPSWRIKFRFAGKERVYSVGLYPTISLESARAERELVKAHLREGRDPLKARQVNRAAATSASGNTFATAAADWLATRKHDWSAVHYDTTRRALERDVLPFIGRLPVDSISPAMVAAIIKSVIHRGARDTAGKILWNCICVFRLAQANGLCRDNPAVPVREILPKRNEVSRRPALLEIDALRDVLRRADVAPLSPSVRLASRLAAFTAARIGNVTEARWEDFDLDSATPAWTIPRAQMKAKDRPFAHKILLGPTIAAELRAWRSRIGSAGFVFPSPMGNAHIGREGVEKAYSETLQLAGKHSPHGWRASFSTLARDAGFAREVVELALDHLHDNDVARAYDRGERLEERRRLCAWWDAQLSAQTSAV